MYPSDDERRAGDFEIGFLCLFCGQEVVADSQSASDLSVETALGVARFTAHLDCVKAAAHNPAIFPDLVTPRPLPPGYVPPSENEVRAWEELNEVLMELGEEDLDADEARQVADELRAIKARLIEQRSDD